ncbi:MAG: Phosphate regulon transcriptional regulatory protein PhoB (SphR), partial [uncultured Solirubrobacteraceae bacterium]
APRPAGHPDRRRRRTAPRHAHALFHARGAPHDGGRRRRGGARHDGIRALRRRPARRRARTRPVGLRRLPHDPQPSRRDADHHAHRAGLRGRRRARPRGGRGRLRHQAVRAGRAALAHPGGDAPRPRPRRRGRRPADRRGGARSPQSLRRARRRDREVDVLGVRARRLPDGATGPPVQPPGAPARDLGRLGLPRSARDRRAHPPPPREARAGPGGSEPHPHRPRRGLPVPGAV